MYTVPTIKEIMQIAAETSSDQQSTLWLYLGDFLDYFYHENRTTQEREQLVQAEPAPNLALPTTTYAFIAATVHKICTDYHVPIPQWTFKPIYFLKEPYFSLNAKGNLRVALLVESPIQFRARHIFTSANTLERV